jgi:hypothetical protein
LAHGVQARVEVSIQGQIGEIGDNQLAGDIAARMTAHSIRHCP